MDRPPNAHKRLSDCGGGGCAYGKLMVTVIIAQERTNDPVLY